ncbi:MAG: hypothetical protein KDC48_14330, partial [Planctomycetes bacterium]|nr:hypothetical protein [Planctomycetota bacterium]
LGKLEEEGDEVREALVSARDRQRPGVRQQELFAPPPDPVVEELAGIDLDDVSPRQALDLLRSLQERSRK